MTGVLALGHWLPIELLLNTRWNLTSMLVRCSIPLLHGIYKLLHDITEAVLNEEREQIYFSYSIYTACSAKQ